MRTTTFLTLTGTGTVIREWLDQLADGTVATPELLLLCAAMAGLGLLTLSSHHSTASSGELAELTPASQAGPALPLVSTSI